jgi:long-chain acyl-CoA synthetase
MPDYDVRLVDPDTLQDVPLGERGEIWIKGPTVMKEYWNNPEETKRSLIDGWLRTGDVAYMDDEGYVFIVDRTKDMIIAGGYNIYPRDIDEVLFKHPKVKDAIAVGIPDEYRGETVKAFVQLVEGAEVTAEELTAFCKQHLAAYKVPKLFEFRAQLPRTDTGKALRRKLREEEIAKMNK